MLILNKNLKNFATVLLIVILTVIDLALPAWAQMQSERYPTDAELQRAIEEFRRDIPILQRSRQFRQAPLVPALESFINAWSQVDPAVAPFIGTWAGQEYDWSIYPSNTRGRVCVLFNHPMRGGTGNNAYFTAVPAVMRYTKVIAKILFLNENLFNRSTRKNSGSTSSGKHIH